RRIYAERPIPIVMLTAYADPPIVERALVAGVFSYLVKPFEARRRARDPGGGGAARRAARGAASDRRHAALDRPRRPFEHRPCLAVAAHAAPGRRRGRDTARRRVSGWR